MNVDIRSYGTDAQPLSNSKVYEARRLFAQCLENSGFGRVIECPDGTFYNEGIRPLLDEYLDSDLSWGITLRITNDLMQRYCMFICTHFLDFLEECERNNVHVYVNMNMENF